MFKKISLVLFFVLLIASCGKNSSKNDDNANNKDNDSENLAISEHCGTSDGNYNDTGYSNYASGLKLKPGQMGSDIADAFIPACSKGQFVFNGTCWDGVLFDDTSGEVNFIKSNTKEVIIKPNTPLSDLMTNYAKTIHSYINRCDIDYGIGNSVQCTVWMGHYPSIYYFAYYTTYMLQHWNMKISSDNYVANKSSSFKFRTTYGTCLKKNAESYNTYDWYHNGSISFSGKTVKLPLSKNNFVSLVPSASAIKCPYLYNDQWVCYQVDTSWGNEILYFDEKSNLNYMTLNYN